MKKTGQREDSERLDGEEGGEGRKSAGGGMRERCG